MKKTDVIVVLMVVVAGLVTGFFSTSIYSFIWPAEQKALSGEVDGQRTSEVQGKKTDSETENLISSDEAINAVKELSVIQTLQRVSEMEDTEITYRVEQEPSDEYPLWLIEVKERSRDRLPKIMYFQVAADSGNVVTITERDLNISEISLSMTRQNVEKILGRPLENKRVYDRDTNRNLRIYKYDGMEVVFDGNGKVERITASGARHQGPKGVKAGDSKEDITKILGKGVSAEIGLIVYTPVDNVNKKFLVKFDGENKVTEITVEITP